MRYLVTGGLGVIGSLFARRMIEQGDKVVIIDASEEVRNEWIYNQFPDLNIVCTIDGRQKRLEKFSVQSLANVLGDCDAVLHAAAHTGIPHSIEDPSDDWASNVDATRVLLEALRKCPRPTVVLSSVKPYRVSFIDEETHAAMAPRGLREEDVLEPDEPYAASKAAQSLLCQAYARSYGLPITVLRCSNLYGPAPCHGPRHGWLTWFCISAAIGREIEVQGSGRQSRDVLHSDDVTEAVLRALRGIQTGEIYNIGGGRENVVSVEQVARQLNKETGVSLRSGPARAMDDLVVFADYSKFRRATGWSPAMSATEGIRRTLAWARENAAELKKLYEGV